MIRRLYGLTPLLLLAVCLASSSAPVQAQDDLTKEEAAWLDELARAGWTGKSTGNGASLSVRNAAVFDQHLLPCLRKAKNLSRTQQAALEEFARLEIPETGWVDNFPVKPGSYTVGLRQGARCPEMFTRDDKGKVVGLDGFWLGGSTTERPKTTATASSGRVTLSANWGDVSFAWTFVSRDGHDKALGELREVVSGEVHLWTDLPEEYPAESLAKEADATLSVHQQLLGVKADGPFHVYLLDDWKRYEALDQLLTQGAFRNHGAFTSHLTGMSYMWYLHFRQEGGIGDPEPPMKIRSLVLHELHHQYAHKAMPLFRYAPNWLQEGLAELAAGRCLAASDKQIGQDFDDLMGSELLLFEASGLLSTPEDLFAEKSGNEIGPYYAGSFALAKAMAKNPRELTKLVQTVAEYSLPWEADAAGREFFDQKFGSAAKILADALAAARKRPFYPVPKRGYCDRLGDAWRVISVPREGGFCVLGPEIAGPTLNFSGEFRFGRDDGGQVDLVTGFGKGAYSERFLKISVLPKRIVAFECNNGAWTTIGVVNYDQELPLTDKDGALWHPFEVTMDAKAKTLRIETTGGRWAQFTLPRYVSLAGTRCGIGAFDGVACFRNLKVATK